MCTEQGYYRTGLSKLTVQKTAEQKVECQRSRHCSLCTNRESGVVRHPCFKSRTILSFKGRVNQELCCQ